MTGPPDFELPPSPASPGARSTPGPVRSGGTWIRVARRIFTWHAWSHVVYGVIAVIVGSLALYELGVLGVYRLSYALLILPGILNGFYTSLELVAVYIPLGFGVGFVVGWARTTQSLVLRGLGSAYVDFFRSMPPLALIFFASLIGAVALKDTSLDPYTQHNITLWLGVIALGLHTGGYQAEIIRAGILSVPAGQTEAADALGISRLRSMFTVTLPQAFRVSLPPLANEFSSVIKDSSYLFIIGWFELAGAGYSYASESYRYHYAEAALVTWFEVALFFFVLTYIVTRTLRGIEDAFRVPGLEAATL